MSTLSGFNVEEEKTRIRTLSMKRKLSSTGGEASDPYGSDEGGGVGGQA
ncbi:hypothetical protein [Candidatus Ichthyocystis hellenicum]|nr:hypothetical protein [Candidatus Ichthyocystis hellenicum]